MNDNAKKWVAALRSGKYQQGRKALNHYDVFCCLGVACTIYQEEVGDLYIELSSAGYYYYNSSHLLLPGLVQDWLNLKDPFGGYIEGDRTTDLTSLNDIRGYNFNQIADLIESEPEGLFKE